MHIVYINGGLGNQVFQYMFFYFLQRLLPDIDIVLDDNKFYGTDVPHHGYELKRIFGIEAPLLSDRFSPDVWRYMTAKRQEGLDIPEQLLREGLSLEVIREKGVKNIKFSGKINDYIPGTSLTLSPKACVYWHGYWLSEIFYNNMNDELDEILKFPPITDDVNLNLLDAINSSRESTAIHIRRGDMVKYGWAAPMSYFNDMIRKIEKEIRPSLYLLFSDDLPYCEAHAEELGLLSVARKLYLVDNNKGDDYYRDLQLMSYCNNRLSDRSSFSLLASLFCKCENKKDWNRWA